MIGFDLAIIKLITIHLINSFNLINSNHFISFYQVGFKQVVISLVYIGIHNIYAVLGAFKFNFVAVLGQCGAVSFSYFAGMYFNFIAAFYINKAKDKEKSLDYFRKWQAADTANAVLIQGYIDQIQKMPAVKPGTKPGTTNPKSTGKTKAPPAKTTSTKATKPSVITKPVTKA